MFLAAALTEPAAPRDYVRKAWLWAHRITMFIGAMAFLLAAAVGAMYLINNRRLRHKHVLPGPDLGSLERLEKLTLAYVSLGFALLTIGMILGLAHYKQLGSNWFANPKFVLGIAAWVVYALVLHSPINPAFRGRRAALLSIIGFLLIFGVFVFVVVQ